MGLFGALETQTMDKARDVFETNFFGVLRLIKAVLPSMKSNREGHVICVSSVGGINGVPFNGIYCASKFAVEGLVESLAPMLKTFNVRSVSIETPSAIMSFSKLKLAVVYSRYSVCIPTFIVNSAGKVSTF